jgi:RimJ/RimL family protein N-acetyltransferase
MVALRPWAEDDAEAIVAICDGDPELARWIDRMPQPYTREDALEYVRSAARGWAGEESETPLAVVDARTGEVVGSVGLTWRPAEGAAEVGYWTARPARDRGIATRATRLVAGWALTSLGYARAELRADPRNAASLRVAEKAGFTFEGVLRSAHVDARDGRRVDHAVYSLLRDELGR